jgi:CBS domain containing-hemolysin-like protein/mannitol/fructose-specific phosphotransferase system IIA component
MFIITVYLLLALLLILLNAFFVLAEFAAVKARPTQMDVLVAKGNKRAKKVQHIQTHIDKYLSVCQIGITLASIGLGFVGEPSLAKLIKPLILMIGSGVAADSTAHGIAIALSYLLISFLHIVIGEQVPKLVAIRKTEKMALYTAYPMQMFYYLFLLPLWFLNSTVNAILWMLRIPAQNRQTEHSEDEIRLILGQSLSNGMMSFRRLLYIENVLDMGTLTVFNAMRVREKVCSLTTGMPRVEIDAVVAKHRHSRYPLIGDDPEKPLGFVHIKDLFLAEHAGKPADDLKNFVHPCLQVNEDSALEQVLSEMQKKGNHMAIVHDKAGKWTGLVTLEDLVEEVVGTIEEEYPIEEQPIRLTSVLSPAYVLLDVEGTTIIAATRNALSRLDSVLLPMPAEEIMRYIVERERAGSSYVGRRLAIPHARLKVISKATIVVARLKQPIPAPTPSSEEKINYLFILLTPSNAPRLHQVLLAHIAAIFESDFLDERMDVAKTPLELFNTICTVEQTNDFTT